MAKLPRLLPLIAVAIGGVVAVRAVGAGPDLFQGAVAWAEEAASAAGEAATPPVRPVPAVCALSPEQLAQQAGISPAELRIIQSLSARRTELDARDADFATTLPLMVAAEQKLDAKITALNAIKAEVELLLGQVDEREEAETARLVSVYSAMRPREAAAVFATLADDVRLPIAAAMRPRSLSAIMAQMPPAAARELTEKLAGRFQAQQLAARAAAASAQTTTPATAPSQTAAAAPTTTAPETQTAAPSAAQPAANRAAASRPPAQRAATRPTPRQPARTPASDTTGTTPPAPVTSPTAQPAAGAPAAGPAAPRQSVQ